MSPTGRIDCVYVAASARDGRFTRTCVASVRHFYPEVPIRLLVGGPLERGLAAELARHWAVEVADLPTRDYGWGFVKLEPLFMPPGHRFLVLDSDTVMSGPVLDLLPSGDWELVVDAEQQDDDAIRQIYCDWIRSADEGHPIERPRFVFNSGQWFGTSGMVSREAFAGLVDWGAAKPRLVNPSVFKNGDQGVLNHVVNQLHQGGRLRVERIPLLCWPGAGMQGITAQSIASRTAPARVVHWAGLKSPWHGRLPGGDVLMLFEQLYYRRGGGGAYRAYASCRHAAAHISRGLRDRVRLRLENSRKALADSSRVSPAR